MNNSRSHSYAAFIDQPLSEGVRSETRKKMEMRKDLARFPFAKGLDRFNCADQAPIDRKQSAQPGLCHFIELGENVAILEPPGVSESRLAVGLCRDAIEHGYRVVRRTADVLGTLTRTPSDNPFGEKLKPCIAPHLLIVRWKSIGCQSIGPAPSLDLPADLETQ